jgi:hypothetical protein
LILPRSYCNAIYIDNTAVLVIGGYTTGDKWTNTIERLILPQSRIVTTATGGQAILRCMPSCDMRWEMTRWTLPNNEMRRSFACQYLNGSLIIMGGLLNNIPTNECWSLDVHNDDSQWISLPSLPEPRYGMASCVWHGDTPR